MMRSTVSRSLVWLAAFSMLSNIVLMPVAGDTATAPGTQITNSASAIYKDAAGNSYNTLSNIVTTTVQNAPQLTNTAGTGTTYAPGQVVTDTFTLVNTGNASGYFQVSGNASAPTTSSDAVLGGTDATFATLGNNAATCTTPVGSQASPCKYAATVGGTTYYFTSLDGSADNNSLDYWLQHTNGLTGTTASIVVSAYYTMSTAATTGNNVTSQIYATITQAAAGTAPLETSASQNATETNNINSDARLDLYKSSIVGTPTATDIQYTISAHNGGAFSAKDLISAKTLVGAGTGGILVTDKIPQFGSVPVPLAVSNSGTITVTTNATYGFATGASTAIYYTTSTTGSSGWTLASGGKVPTDGSVYYIGIYVSGGSCGGTSGFELCADTGHATTPGNANVAAAAALQFQFSVTQPTGPGSGNPGAVTNMANGVIGDNQPTEHILGPGGTLSGTTDSTSTTALTTAGQGINNVTPSTTGTPIGGASNQTSDAATTAYNALVGPFGVPASSGSFDGAATASTSNDFTAFPIGQAADTPQNTSTTPGSPTTAQTSGASQTVCIPNTLENNGNSNDTYSVTVYAPTAFGIPTTGGQSYAGSFSAGGTQVAGWSVGLYSNSTCSTNLGGAIDGSTTSTATGVAVTSGSTTTLYVKYVVPAATKYFYRYDSLIHAVSAGDTTKVNDTHDDLYANFIALTKSQSIVTGCPAGLTPAIVSGVCSGGTITYSVDYRNLVLGSTDTNVSFDSTITTAGTLGITDDGTTVTTSSATQNNWATFATINAAPVDTTSTSTTRAATTYAYYTGIPPVSAGSFSTGVTKFVGTIGGAGFQLVPKNYLAPSASQDWQGTLSFAVTVK
ncbi:MAG TPA: hypothetical protein VMW12_01385 [Candidatus Dormibacteraeota bacterium]|nr:hypothetical protein [Candidatus Dormibacteraeota bacterium]